MYRNTKQMINIRAATPPTVPPTILATGVSLPLLDVSAWFDDAGVGVAEEVGLVEAEIVEEEEVAEEEVKKMLAFSGSSDNLAATRSSVGQEPSPHGFDLQHPINGPLVQVNQFWLVPGEAQSWTEISSYLEVSKPAGYRPDDGQRPEPSAHGSTSQHPMNLSRLSWQM